MSEHFHRYEQKLKRAREIVRDGDLSARNKKDILGFCDYCFSQGLSTPRVEKYMGHLRQLAPLLAKDFADATREDLQAVVARIERSQYSAWTKHDLRVTLKKLYPWLRDTEGPPETAWLRCGNARGKHRLPEELLTEDDIAKLLDACLNTRDKAFISVLYESGCRIGEIASLRLKHVVPNTHGYRLIVSGKTGTRRLLVVSSAPYLTAWLNDHPHKGDPQAYLWVTRDRRVQRLGYPRMSNIITRAAAAAGVTKRVNPHTFRHSRATHLANHLTEAQMNEFFGWTQGSDMPSIYVHLSGRDVDEALLRTYGIQVEDNEKQEARLKPKPCPRCAASNAPTNAFCNVCGCVLDKTVADELTKRDLERSKADEIMDRLVEDPDFRALLMRKLQQLPGTQKQA